MVKEEVEDHGEVTLEYVDYNLRDVISTWELYRKVIAEYKKHPVELEPGKAYSPASIGKAYFRAMGIKPLVEKQPDFPQEILGYAMQAYYGGRAECHIRRVPTKVFHVDVTSMYPSVFILQNLWSWVIANRFEIAEATEEVRSFIENVTLDALFKKETWAKVSALVQVIPENDLLPVRANYERNFQIGLNYLTSEKPLWYIMADVIAAKILTGKAPQVLKAIKIILLERQQELVPVKLQGIVPVNPGEEDFFTHLPY